MWTRRWMMAAAFGAALLFGGAGCVSVKAPERIEIGNQRRGPAIDPSQVPPTRSHEEARQKLAEAYAEIRRLREDVAELEEDKRELKEELDAAESERDAFEEKYERLRDRR